MALQFRKLLMVRKTWRFIAASHIKCTYLYQYRSHFSACVYYYAMHTTKLSEHFLVAGSGSSSFVLFGSSIHNVHYLVFTLSKCVLPTSSSRLRGRSACWFWAYYLTLAELNILAFVFFDVTIKLQPTFTLQPKFRPFRSASMSLKLICLIRPKCLFVIKYLILNFFSLQQAEEWVFYHG